MFLSNHASQSLEKRRQLQKQRLKHRVEIQSRQIEKVMEANHLPGHVSGGRVASQAIQFDLQTQLSSSWDRLRELTTDLRQALGVPEISISRENGRLQVAVGRPQDVPVTLLDILTMAQEFPPETAVIGLSETGAPVMLPLKGSHVLISGAAEAGKTSLLRTISASLAMLNRQSYLQQIIISPALGDGNKTTALDPLAYLPHLVTDIIYDLSDAAQVLAWLVEEMENRAVTGEILPKMVVMIDNGIELMAAGGAPIVEPLIQLLQRGQEQGIHLILSTRHPEDALLDSHVKANLPIRLTGRMIDAQQAAAATGIAHSEAEYLLGQGDFLLMDEKETTYFQAAFVGDYDLHLCLMKLQSTHHYAILAQPFNIRLSMPEVDYEYKKDEDYQPQNGMDFFQ